MSVRRLKDGRWTCYYRISCKQKTEYFGRGLEAQKNAEIRDEEIKTQLGTLSYNRHVTMDQGTIFETLALEYLNVKHQTDMTKSSVNALEYKLSAVILPELGHLQASTITHKRLDEYVSTRLSKPRTVNRGTKKRPVIKTLKNSDGTIRYISRSTVHRELCDIQAILNWAVSRQYLLANPVIGHKKPKKDDDIIKPPSIQETRSILKEAAPHLIRALKISFFTGLRPGSTELFRLTWEDVDFEERTIFIISAKKDGIPFRVVPLHDELLSDLRRWYKDDQGKTARQIITFKDKPIKTVKTAFKAAKRRAGITRRMRMYDFRHAAITNMLAADGDLKSISEIAGHSRTDTTTKIYQHTSTKLLRRQIEKLPGLAEHGNYQGDKIIDFQTQKLHKKSHGKNRK
jgi:integrase